MEEKDRNWRSNEEDVEHNQLLLNKNRWFVLCVEFLVLAFSLFAFAALLLPFFCCFVDDQQARVNRIYSAFGISGWIFIKFLRVHCVTAEWFFRVWFELIISSPLVLESWHVYAATICQMKENRFTRNRKSHTQTLLYSVGLARSASVYHFVSSKYVCIINQTFIVFFSFHHRIIKKLSEWRSPIWMECEMCSCFTSTVAIGVGWSFRKVCFVTKCKLNNVVKLLWSISVLRN